MNKSNSSYWFTEISAALLILLFMYTGMNKLMEYGSFQRVLLQFPVLSPFSGTLAWLLPVLEILIAFLLMFPASKTVGFLLSFGLLGLFTIYTGYLLSLDATLPCHCGGYYKGHDLEATPVVQPVLYPLVGRWFILPLET